MRFHEFDTMVLQVDMPSHGLKNVELKPIKTRLDYRAALKLAEKLWDAPESSADADRLDVLTLPIPIGVLSGRSSGAALLPST